MTTTGSEVGTISNVRAALRTACAKLAYARAPLLAVSMAALIMALWAGLMRLGWGLPPIQSGLYTAHGPLMVSGFLGTLISLERAVALGEGWAYAAPSLSGLGALALIIGVPDLPAALLITLGSAGLIANFLAILRKQAALFTVTMTLGAMAWFIGNCLWLAGMPIIKMFFWWTGFLVLTIMGERLELSRLTGLDGRGKTFLLFSVGLFSVSLAISSRIPAAGLRLAGLSMLAMALWLARYDLARRTVKQHGLTRFIALNLLAGYFWLGIGGIAWLFFGDDLTTFHYDMMLHTVFLGFVFSMIFAHAPLIFPAVLQRPLRYGGSFYAHSVLLHLSLAVRMMGDLSGSYPAYEWGALLNVLAVLVFVANTVRAAVLGMPQGGRRSMRAAILHPEVR